MSVCVCVCVCVCEWVGECVCPPPPSAMYSLGGGPAEFDDKGGPFPGLEGHPDSRLFVWQPESGHWWWLPPPPPPRTDGGTT